MSSPILLTGGTGTLGRLVLPRLLDAGCTVRILSRASHPATNAVEYVSGDLTTGEGIDKTVIGVETVVHLAGTQKGDADKARHLVQAASRSGVRHLVYISVVGADRVPVTSGIDRALFGYFASKRDAERVVAESGLQWTTLRATQFHDLVFMTTRQLAKLPFVPTFAGVKFQPVEASEVADRIAEIALAAPAGLVPDIGGPKIYGMADLVRSYLKASGKRRLTMPMWLPGGAARAIRAGANLTPDRAVGRRTWEDFLAERVAKGR